MNRWTDEEVRILMCIFSYDDIQRELDGSSRNEKVWQKVVSLLAELGVDHTAKQCREKIKKLKQDYKKIKHHNNRSGSDRRTSKWYYLLDAILGHRPPYSGMVTPTTGETTPDEGTSPVEDEQSVEASLEPSFISAPTAPSSPCLSASSPEPTTTCHKDTDHSAWMPEEVQIFLTLWAEPSIQEQLSTMGNKSVFTHLSNQLASVGFHKTPHQCRLKVKKLKQEYKKNKCMKDSKHVKSTWFAIMDSVLDPGEENETNDSKEVDSPAVLTHPGSSEDEHTNDEQSVEASLEPSFISAPTAPSSPCLSASSPEPTTTCHKDKLRTRWTPEEVHVLLAWWAKESVQEQLTSTLRHEKLYTKLSSQFATLGFDKTPSQCRLKLKKLRQEYKRAKDQKVSKYGQRTWFAVLDKVLRNQRLEAETEEAAEVMDSAPVSLETPQHGSLAEDLGGCLTFSALSLVVPTLRLMCAFAWQVVQHCNVMHYGKVEELVRLVTEMVPEVLTPREKVNLLFKLRARLVLELCRSESTANPLVIQPHLKVIHNLPNGSNNDQEDAEELENSMSNFVEIVHTLLKDPEERNTFFKEVFPVHYGQQYEATLHTLVWKFISRLDELLPVPDVKQTAEWLSTAPSVMEECGQLVLEPDQLKTLLHCHHRHPRNSTKRSSPDTHDAISSTLPLKAKPRRVTSDQINSSRSKGTRYSTEPRSDCNKDEGQSDHSREEEEEEEPAEENQSDDEWTPDNCSKRSQVLEVKDKPRKSPSPVKHSDLQRIVPLRLHTCSLCPYSHTQVAGLLQHIRKEHLVKQPSHPASDAPETDSVPPQAEMEICIDAMRSRTYTCNHCARVFRKKSALTRHMASHTRPFRCNYCDKRYTQKAFLDKHQRVHTGERPYQCSHCGRAFMCQYTLKAHIRTHTGDRPYKCHICGKTSIQHQARHILMHKGEKNYLCTECGKAFLTSGELRLHMRYHTGERPYTCKHCGKGFIAKCHLTIHMRTHTGERPYRCTECPKSFPTSNLRKRHMFIHYDKKPFQCFKCGKGFTQACAMKIHIRTRRCK